MRFTLHFRHSMSRRGIPQRLVALTLRHGRIDGDRRVLDRREVEGLRKELRLAMHVLDNGGITVVEDEGNVITAWNFEQALRSPSPELHQ